MLIKTLASGFYARQDIRTPVRIAIVAMIANTVCCALLIKPLAHVGLALATSLSALLNAALLAGGLLKLKIFQPQPGWKKFSLQMLLASLVMGAVLWLAKGDINQWFIWHSIQRSMHLLGLILVAFLSYFGCLWLTGMRLNDFKVQ